MNGRERAILYALLPGPATGLTIMEVTGRTPLIYYSARRLERLGYVRSFERIASPAVMAARGGRPRRYYALTLSGQAWLDERPKEMP